MALAAAAISFSSGGGATKDYTSALAAANKEAAAAEAAEARAIRGRGNPKKTPGRPVDFTDDNVWGKQYTNFERKPRQSTKKSDNKWEKVSDMPEEMESIELTVDPENCICFSGRNHWLANFYRASMNIDGHTYPSVEHYYQACKLYMLGGARFSNQIRRIPDAGSCKVTTRRLLRGVATAQQIEEWKMHHSPHILEHAMVNKFVQHPKLREKLLETGDKLLVHTYELDRVFAAGMNNDKFLEWAKDNNSKTIKIPTTFSSETLPFYPLMGDGKNILGLIISRVRSQIRRFHDNMISGTDISDPILAAAVAALDLQPKEEEKKKEEEPKDTANKQEPKSEE